MRVAEIQLQRFKRFKDFSLKLDSEIGLPNLVLLIGDNGAGKTTILQAIAATLGTATRQITHPEELNWAGFVPRELSSNHRGFSQVQLDVHFTDEELNATREYFARSDYAVQPNATSPNLLQNVKLVWDTNPSATYPVSSIPIGAGYFFQFQGRRYAYNLLYNRNAVKGMFENIGGVFWYTEQRTSFSLAPFVAEGVDKEGKSSIRQIDNEEAMRRLLTRWFALDKEPRQNNKLNRFNQYYSRLFPGRKLVRIVDSYGASFTPILFSDGQYEYDVSELSGGERSLLPLLLDFVEWGIHNSVVLIDELELHLHPPLQQALLTLLPELGKNNQFIMTTHSDSVASLVPNESIKRVSLHEYSH